MRKGSWLSVFDNDIGWKADACIPFPVPKAPNEQSSSLEKPTTVCCVKTECFRKTHSKNFFVELHH